MASILNEKTVQDFKSLCLAIRLSEGVEAREFDTDDVEVLKRVVDYVDKSRLLFNEVKTINLAKVKDLDELYRLVGEITLKYFNQLKVEV